MTKTKEKKSYTGLKLKTVVILTSIVIFLTAIAVTLQYIEYCYSQVDHELQITINSEIKRSNDAACILEEYEKSTQDTGKFMLDYSTYYLNEYGVCVENLNTLSGRIPVNLYYSTVDEDGKIRTVTAMNSKSLMLSENEQELLFKEGYYEKTSDEGQKIYCRSNRVGDGFLIVCYGILDMESGGYDMGRPYTAKADEVLLWTDKDKNIISSSSEAYDGKSINEVVQEMYPKSPTEICTVNGIGPCIVKKQYEGDKRLYAILPVGYYASNLFRSVMVPVTLLLVVFFTILIFVIKVKKESDEPDGNRKIRYIKVTKGLVFDRKVASHIVTMALFGIILIGMTLFYVSAVVSYSNQSIIANENLKGLSDNYDRAHRNQENNEYLIESELANYGNYIALGFMSNPDTLDSNALKKMVNYVSSILSVNVTNGSATVVASTTNEVGYTYGKNDNEVNSNCWKILDGESDYEVSNRGDYSADLSMYTVHLRRQDEKGVIIINFGIDSSIEMAEKWSLQETMLTTDMGDATCLAFTKDEPEKLYIAEPDASEIIILDSTLDEKVVSDGYTGIQRVKGIRYFLNTLYNSENDICFISALPTKKIPYSAAFKCLVSLIIGMTAFVFILLFGAGIVRNEIEEQSLQSPKEKNKIEVQDELSKKEDTKTEGRNLQSVMTGDEQDKSSIRGLSSITINNIDDLMNERFKNDIRNMIIINGILLVLLLGIDYIIQDKPLIEYLLSSQWNKGVNLFSVTMILIVMVGCAFLGFILNKLITLIFSNMGRRAMTIGNLLNSLMRFMFLIIAVMWSLKELGVNMSALIAGAGIAGAAISFCASATINDLISGFFIVFEGSFKIGDWIRVDDFRGQVISIGIRTTKLACSDCVKILNNSTLTNVTVLDHTNTGAIARIDVAYKENVEAVIELINNNRELYIKEIPEIQDGPYVRGVVDLGTNGVTIEMYALGEQEHVAKIERGIRLVSKRLFDENDIEIPFAQVTIHNE